MPGICQPRWDTAKTGAVLRETGIIPSPAVLSKPALIPLIRGLQPVPHLLGCSRSHDQQTSQK
ncbi:hypothetical protein EXN66_Car018877 [Channa argus]|uniref:Uncharacterized protein n=1 Tax=Channa argus TaxID=215402 RepID=A0A6G1QLE1_CHAAH|nr:hypothetical protein EXN66_Car018877 [Channa argus]